MIWIVLGILALILVWYVVTYNSFVSLNVKCDEAYSTMDIYLKKRYDLIPNLVETVKGYAKHESVTLENVVAARGMAVNARTPQEKAAAEGTLSGALSRLMAISESYPELKANTNFLDLQNQLKTMESEIANSRKYYNGVVKSYNIKCQSIPSSIVASLAHFQTRPLFEITDQAERANVKVQF